MNFVKVFQVNHGETIINLDNVVQIEKTGSFYRLYFNAVLIGKTESYLYSIDILDNIERLVKDINDMK